MRHALILAAFLASACGRPAESNILPSTPQDTFWNSIQQLCGRAYEGRLAEGSPTDTIFETHRLVMHVRQCGASEVRIPFHVGNDHSRTWILTRLNGSIRLKHDHRHADGSEDEITQYGGDTADEGTAERQEFPADAFTAGLVPAAATNVWTIEVVPGVVFAYALRREGSDRRFRVEFDLKREVETPPTPWGY
jgi:hypothetical protein